MIRGIPAGKLDDVLRNHFGSGFNPDQWLILVNSQRPTADTQLTRHDRVILSHCSEMRSHAFCVWGTEL